MVVVGFDVGKDSVFGARLDRSGQVKQRWELVNTPKAIEPMLAGLRGRYKYLVVGSEATAEYHRPLAQTCLRLGIPFRLLNPITTKQFTRATVRKRKTDLSDAVVIAKLVVQGEGTLVNEQTFNPMKPVLRTSVKLTQMTQALLLMEQHLKVAAPEARELQGELEGCRARLEQAIAVLRQQAMQASPHDLQKLLTSIPGIGPTIATTLIVEIGDITRFRSPKSLVAYAGLDPRVRQSGYTLQRNTRLTKRGSPYLRRVSYLAASIAQRHDEEFKATFDQKRAEGKRYKEATIVNARKLLNRVYAVWKRGEPYQPGLHGKRI